MYELHILVQPYLQERGAGHVQTNRKPQGCDVAVLMSAQLQLRFPKVCHADLTDIPTGCRQSIQR